MRGLILFVLIASVPATSCFATSARRAKPASIVALPVVVDGPEAIGCYWERGRSFCSRYCYVEVNGFRYCQERPHQAWPQAPLVEIPAYQFPMK